MTQTSYPKGGGTTTDAQYADLFDSIVGTGVRAAGDLLVTGDSSGMNVKVSSGFAVVAGSAFNSDAVTTLTITPNATGTTRIDTVVLIRDTTQASVITLAVLTGAAAAPTLTQIVNGLYQEALADIAVPNGTATITAAMVTDRRKFMSSRVKAWTTAQRPAGRLGQLGYNLSTSAWEFFSPTGWGPLVPATFTAAQISDPQNLTAGRATTATTATTATSANNATTATTATTANNALLISGQAITVAAAAPSSPGTNDLWFW